MLVFACHPLDALSKWPETLESHLLVASGGTWDHPPSRIRWEERHKRVRDEIIRAESSGRSWGFKDPRTLCTLDGWLEALPGMKLIGVFRHPVPVARSLQNRGGFTLSKCFDLWLKYNQRLLGYHERFGFPILSFDVPGEAFTQRVAAAAIGLGMAPCTGDTGFFEPSLRHFSTDDEARMRLPGDVASLYARLKELAV